MKRRNISFENGYFYEGSGLKRKSLAYMNRKGEITKSSLWTPMLAYFDAETGGIYENKGCYDYYYSQLARIENTGYFYLVDEAKLIKKNIVGKMYTSEVENIYKYLNETENTSIQKNDSQPKKSKEGGKPPFTNYLIKILAIIGGLFLGAVFLFSAFGIYSLMSKNNFTEYWWHLISMIGSFIAMLFVPKVSNWKDYLAMYVGYTVITSIIIAVFIIFSAKATYIKIISVILLPIIMGGSYLIPSIIGVFVNKIFKAFK